MAVNYGIYPVVGKAHYYSETKNAMEITFEGVDKNDIDLVDSMYEALKTDKNFGYACIYLHNMYGNEIRKKFVDSGIKVGFKGVKIINLNTFNYFNAICKIDYVFKSDEILWIFLENAICDVWQVTSDERMKFAYSAEFDYTETFEIKMFMENTKLNKSPNVILYNYLSTKNLKFLDKLFPDTLFFRYDKYPLLDKNPDHPYSNYREGGCLVAAERMANSINIVDVIPMLHHDLMIMLDDKEIMVFKKSETLPMKMSKKITSNKKCIHVLSDKKKQTFFIPLITSPFSCIYFNIDLNGIYWLKWIDLKYDFEEFIYSNIVEKIQQIQNFNPFVKDVIPFDIYKKYSFPRRFTTNDDQINAIGIDLGTSRCCVAVNRTNGIQTIALDNQGQRLLPSWVAFDEVEPILGQVVIDRLRNHAKSTVFDVKRIIGRQFDQIQLNQSWPFELIKARVGNPKEIDCWDNWSFEISDTNNIVIKICNERNEPLLKLPEEISAVLLRFLKETAIAFQGRNLHNVVITVPASFTKSQKDSTIIAAALAGWKKVDLLPEPIAAAFAYFIDRPLENNINVLLFDLGGGTLDVCIFKVEKDQIQIISKEGNPNLGGRDFDNLLIEHFSQQIFDNYGISINADKKCKLMLKCQKIKEDLSVLETVNLDLEDIDPTIEEITSITRKEFEYMSKRLLLNMKNCISAVLDNIGLRRDQIDKVLLVGGGCRMPMIKTLLKKIFPFTEHCCEEHPDEVVAIGAAYYSYFIESPSRNAYQCSIN